MEKGRSSIYQIIDSLVRKYKNYDEYGRSTYHDTSDWAAIFKMLDEFKGVISVSEYFFKSGNVYEGINFSPLLIIAIEEHNFLAAKELLKKYNANPNIESFGVKSYELSKKYGQLKEELVQKNDLNKNEGTALRAACFKFDVPMIKLLLMYGAKSRHNIIEEVKEKKKGNFKTRTIKEEKKIDEVSISLNQFK